MQTGVFETAERISATFDLARRNVIHGRSTSKVVTENPSNGSSWVPLSNSSHLGDDLIPRVPPRRPISVQPIERCENLSAAGGPSADPAGDREIKGWSGQPLVSEE